MPAKTWRLLSLIFCGEGALDDVTSDSQLVALLMKTSRSILLFVSPGFAWAQEFEMSCGHLN
jgi:hypothetical protein